MKYIAGLLNFMLGMRIECFKGLKDIQNNLLIFHTYVHQKIESPFHNCNAAEIVPSDCIRHKSQTCARRRYDNDPVLTSVTGRTGLLVCTLFTCYSFLTLTPYLSFVYLLKSVVWTSRSRLRRPKVPEGDQRECFGGVRGRFTLPVRLSH